MRYCESLCSLPPLATFFLWMNLSRIKWSDQHNWVKIFKAQHKQCYNIHKELSRKLDECQFEHLKTKQYGKIINEFSITEYAIADSEIIYTRQLWHEQHTRNKRKNTIEKKYITLYIHISPKNNHIHARHSILNYNNDDLHTTCFAHMK